MNKFVNKLLIAIDNSHIAKSILAVVFILIIIVGFYKLDSVLRYWLG